MVQQHAARAGDAPYRPIEDYALIGDGLTAALVSRDGAIDWACFPRFDAPSVFARLLDADDGGYWQIAPVDAFTVERAYLPDTAVVATRFTTATGAIELLDFMPPQQVARGGRGEHAIVRLVRGLHGSVEIATRLTPRFDYGRERPWWMIQEGAGVRAAREDEALTLFTDLPLRIVADVAEGRRVVASGEEVAFLLAYRRPFSPLWPGGMAGTARQLLDQTVAHWHEWIGRCTYTGPHAAMVRRSALTLKLLDYLPSGAIVAAPTTSLPEAIGGERNWDYRYAWVRDTAFALYALFGLGYREEAEAFLGWIVAVSRRDPLTLQVLYGIEGERQIAESILTHLRGYRDSRPVRIGNAAYDQRQLDIYGEVVDCAFLHFKHGGTVDPELWAFVRGIVDYVCAVWTEPDQGIWEVRSGPRHFVYSKAICWVALDRGVKLARRAGLPADVATWERIRDEIHAELLREGYNEALGSFTQTYGGTELDAAALALLLRKVLPAADPRMRSTVARVATDLREGDFLHRYTTERVDDGVGGPEGAFLMCSFWLVDCLAEMGQIAEAEDLFARLLAHANDVGLYAEEIDPSSGEHRGNFPQAFTHIALINAALVLARAQGGAG